MRHLGDGATVTSSGDGVRVSKVPEPDGEPVPSVRLAVTSTVRDPVEVTVVELVPDDVTVDDVVLSSSYRPQELTVEDGRLRFDAVVRPGETVEVVYGLDEDAAGDVCSLLSSPIVERTARLETVDGGEADLETEGDDALAAADPADHVAAGPDAGATSAVLTRGGTAAADEREPAGAGAPGADAPGPGAPSNEPTDGDRADGRATADVDDEIERRLAALDRQFHRLEEFFDAAGGFLDDGDLPRDVLSDLADQRYSIRRRHRALAADLSRLEADVEALVEAVSSDLTALESRLESRDGPPESGRADSAGDEASDRARDRRLDVPRDD